jgi:thiamine thiazole synthase
MYNRLLILLIALIFFLPLKAQERDLTIEELAHNFATPKAEYGAYVWWHWMGSNFSKEGITKDLEAMKEAGIAGATIFNCYTVEDVIFKSDVVSGVVVNWTPVLREGMHVDPLNIMAKCVVDGTGHDSEMCCTVARKNGIRLATDTGGVIGERSLDVVSGEEEVVNGTKEIYPGLYVCGMAASAVSGTPRMGPIFGGMLLSGKKVADLIIEKLKR